jgi:hypothetical protein
VVAVERARRERETDGDGDETVHVAIMAREPRRALLQNVIADTCRFGVPL